MGRRHTTSTTCASTQTQAKVGVPAVKVQPCDRPCRFPGLSEAAQLRCTCLTAGAAAACTVAIAASAITSTWRNKVGSSPSPCCGHGTCTQAPRAAALQGPAVARACRAGTALQQAVSGAPEAEEAATPCARRGIAGNRASGAGQGAARHCLVGASRLAASAGPSIAGAAVKLGQPQRQTMCAHCTRPRSEPRCCVAPEIEGTGRRASLCHPKT